MQSFDHEAAWTELAKPAFDALPPEVHALIEATKRDAADLAQLKDLTMPWPETDLKSRYEALPDETLARAARIVNCYGHWAFTNEGRTVQAHGTHWKFSHYADQVLRERLGIQRGKEPNGISLRIHEGMLRVCVKTPSSWTWKDIGLATRANVDGLRAKPDEPRDPRPGGSSSRRVPRETWDEFSDAAIRWLDGFLSGKSEPLLDTARFMVDESVMKARAEARADAARAARDERFFAENPFAFGRYVTAIVATVIAFPDPKDAHDAVWHLLLKIPLADANKERLLDTVANEMPEFVSDYRARERARKAHVAKLLAEPRPS